MQKPAQQRQKLSKRTIGSFAKRVLFAVHHSRLATPVVSIRVRARGQMQLSIRRRTSGMALMVIGLAVAISLVASLIHPLRTVAVAATNTTINFQSRLQTPGGAIAPDGWCHVGYKMYSVATSGTAEWTEDYTYNNGSTSCTAAPLGSGDCRIQVVNGYLTADLGSLSSFPGTINWDQQQWVTMNISNPGTFSGPGAITWDGEMSPRLQMTAVPYAFRAGQLALLTGSNTSTLGFAAQTGAHSLLLPNEDGTVCTNATSGVCSALGFYIQNQTASPQTSAGFNIAGAGTIGGALTVTGLATANGGLTVNSAAASGISVTSGSSVPTADQISITNTGSSGVTTAGVNGLGVSYKGGAGAIESAAIGVDLQPGTTSGSTWSGVQI